MGVQSLGLVLVYLLVNGSSLIVSRLLICYERFGSTMGDSSSFEIRLCLFLEVEGGVLNKFE